MGLSVAGAEALSAGLGFGASVFGSTASGLFGANQAKKNRAFQERMYNRQVEDSINFWKMQNEYNLPSAQLQRLRDAGMNPLLAYGEGGMSGNIASQSPDLPSAPHGAQGSANIGAKIELANLALVQKQAENLEADSRLKRSEAAKNLDEVAFNRSTWDYRKDALFAENEYKSALFFKTQLERDQVYAAVGQAYATIDALEADVTNKTRMTDQEIKESDQRIENSIKETAASVARQNAEARKLLADAYYNEAMAKIVSDPRYKDSVIKEKVESVRQAIANADAAEIEKTLLEFKKSMLPIGNEWYNQAGYWYKKYVELTIGPLADIIGKALGGSVSAAIKKN